MQSDTAPLPEFTGKTIVMTGASSGLGLALAEQFCDLGARLICLSRREPILSSPVQAGQVEFVQVDLASVTDARRAAAEVARSAPVIDLIICNAATLLMHNRVTSEGLERHLAVNYLSHYALVELLKSNLLERDGTSVAVVGSVGAARAGGCAKDDFFDATVRPIRSYEVSKWALSGYVRSLNRSFQANGSRRRACVFQAPMMMTNIMNDFSRGWKNRMGLKLLKLTGSYEDIDAVAGSVSEWLGSPAQRQASLLKWSRRQHSFVLCEEEAIDLEGLATLEGVSRELVGVLNLQTSTPPSTTTSTSNAI